MRKFTLWTLFISAVMGEVGLAQVPRTTADDLHVFTIFAESDDISTGYVIVNGEYVARPFVLVRKDDTVFINNRPLPRGQAATRPTSLTTLVEQVLQNDGLLIAVNDKLFLLGGQRGRLVLEALIADEPAEKKLASIQSALEGQLSGTVVPWAGVVKMASSDGFQRRLRKDLGFEKSPEVANAEASAEQRTAPWRLWLNAAGMILAVIALAHVLMYRPEIRRQGASPENLGDGYRLVPRFIVVVLVLAIFDLIYTMLADRSGGFFEMNPIGGALLHFPLALIGFKITATLVGAALLLRLRKYNAAQFASWCVCLVYTMLTFRWAIYNSLFFG